MYESSLVHSSRVINVVSCKTDWPFAGSKNPAEDDPERQHDDDEDRAWTDGHEGLEDEPRVEVDAIQSADTSWRCVREQAAM